MWRIRNMTCERVTILEQKQAPRASQRIRTEAATLSEPSLTTETLLGSESRCLSGNKVAERVRSREQKHMSRAS